MEARRAGSVLIAVLWCFVLLGVAAVSMLHTTQLELRIVKNHADRIQARFLALAGAEKARALIASEGRRLEAEGRSFDRTLIDDNRREFADVSLGRGMFRIIRAPEAGETAPRGMIHGLTDLGGRLDLNAAGIEELRLVPGMTEEVVAALKDWRDKDSETTPGGAEIEVYASLTPPYRPRNGPFDGLLEALRVLGVRPDLLLGEDANANGILDPAEDDGPRTPPDDDADGVLDAGWSAFLSVGASALDITLRGELRVDLKSATEETLTKVEGVSPDLAKGIVAARGNLASVANLLDVKSVAPEPQPGAPVPANPPPAPPPGPPGRGRRGAPSIEGPGSAPPPAAPPQGAPGNQNQQGGGQNLVDESLLKSIADSFSVGSETEAKGLVNINSAGVTVLACLPGMTDELAAAAVAWRESRGFYATVAELLDVPGMTAEAFKKMCPRVTVRAGTFRVLSEGIVPSTGARARILTVVRLDDDDVTVLEYREDA